MEKGVDEEPACAVRRAGPGLQLAGRRHGFIDRGDCAGLFGERWYRHRGSLRPGLRHVGHRDAMASALASVRGLKKEAAEEPLVGAGLAEEGRLPDPAVEGDARSLPDQGPEGGRPHVGEVAPTAVLVVRKREIRVVTGASVRRGCRPAAQACPGPTVRRSCRLDRSVHRRVGTAAHMPDRTEANRPPPLAVNGPRRHSPAGRRSEPTSRPAPRGNQSGSPAGRSRKLDRKPRGTAAVPVLPPRLRPRRAPGRPAAPTGCGSRRSRRSRSRACF